MSNNLEERVASVKSKLISISIKVKNEWISGCVNFFLSQSPEISDEELYQAALQQFLLADVKDASIPVIPPTIQQNKSSFTLSGNFVLQMQFLIDIAESPYEQKRRLYNIKLDEAELEAPESKSFKTNRKRMFKLELTDGYKTVSAMEYTTIPCLSSKLSPGTKLKLIGPMQVVNHIILLEPQNLTILGGDVEHLVIENAYENVLLRALNRPTTQTPLLDYNEEALIENVTQAPPLTRQPSIVPPRQQSVVPPVPTNQQTNNLNEFDFDDDDVDLEAILLLEQEDARNREAQNENFVNQDFIVPVDVPMDVVAPVHVPMDVDDNPSEFIEITDENLRPVIRSQRPRISSETIVIEDEVVQPEINRNKSLLPRMSGSLPNSDEPVLKKIARIEPTNMLTIWDDHYKFKTQAGDNLVTVDQYLSIKTSDKLKKRYVILGNVSVVKAIRCKNKGWLLECEITDRWSKQQLDVKFQSSVVESLSERTYEEMMLMYKEMKTHPHIKQDIVKIIETINDKLQRLNCFMKIEMELLTTCQSCYVVVELIDTNENDSRTFSNKLREEKLQPVH